jgi:hypothetical protein
MQPTPLELTKDNIFVNEIYRGFDEQFLYLDKECDPIIDKIKKNNQQKLDKGEIKSLPNSYHSDNLWQHDKFNSFVNFVMQQMWNILNWQGYPDSLYFLILGCLIHIHITKVKKNLDLYILTWQHH